MFGIIGKLKCPVCSKIVHPKDKVFLDIINTVIHQRCYYQYYTTRKFLPFKDQGTFQKMLLKYPFFQDGDTSKGM